MRTPSSTEDQAAALLRNPGRVRAVELVKLIRDVNPSGLELPNDVQQRRYKVKSQLQSLLIRKFRDDIAITRSAEFGVVGLRYRPENQSACHAVVSELDEDARSYVQLQIDLGKAEEEKLEVPAPAQPRARNAKQDARTASTSSSDDPRILVQLGREALAAYDYPGAHEFFARAFDLSRGAAPETLAFLQFLVGEYGMYAEACALFDRISEDAFRNGEVRGLLALAAAHVGEFGLSALFLDGARGDHAGAAWALLGQAALADQRLDEAEKCLVEAKRISPALPDLISLERDLSQKRADARRPEEDLLEQLVAAGNESAAEAKANGILQRWPDSVLARRVLRELANRRRAAEAEALHRDGEQAFAAGDYDGATSRWRKAQDLGANDLDGRIAVAKEKQAERARTLEVERVAAEVKVGLTAKALAQYAELDDACRQRVREQTRIGELGLMDALLDGAATNREHNAAVAAVLALLEAVKLDLDRDQARVLELLVPHERQVARLDVGRELLERCRRAAHEAALAAATRSLTVAREALAADDLDGAQRLAMAARGSPNSQLQAEAQAVLDEIRVQAQSKRRRDQYESLVGEDRLVEALDVVRAACADPIEPAEYWRQRKQGLTERIRVALNIDVVESEDGIPSPEYVAAHAGEEISYGLDPAGDRLFWASSHGRHLFVRRCSLRDGCVNAVVALRLPEPLEFPHVQVNEGTLWISGSGSVLALSTETWDVLQWRSKREVALADEVPEQELLIPEHGMFWISVRPKAGHDETIRVFRLGEPRALREIRGGLVFQRISRGSEPTVFVPGYERGGRVFSASGVQVLQTPRAADALAPSPAGGYIAQLVTDDEKDSVSLAVVDAAGRVTTTLPVPDLCRERVRVTATALDAQVVFVLFHDDDGTAHLIAYAVDSAELRQLWVMAAPRNSSIVQDLAGTTAALLFPAQNGPRVIVLGREAPSIPPDAHSSERRPLPLVNGWSFCGRPPRNEDVVREAERVDQLASSVARLRAADEVTLKRMDDPLALVQFAAELRVRGHTREAANTVADAKRAAPDHPWVRIAEAEQAKESGDWSQVLEVLSTTGATSLGDSVKAHVHHLRGLALYQIGEYGEARNEYAAAAAAVAVDACGAADWVPWLQALENADSDDGSEAAQLLGAIRRSDAHLASGEGAKAVAELDTRRAWSSMDVQLAARLAEGVLLRAQEPLEVRVRKRLLLATYVAQFDRRRDSHRGRLPLGPLAWSEERLADVAGRARAWLGQE